LKRKAAGTIRIADHESFEDEIRGLDREDGGNQHHQEKERSFSFAEFAFVGPRWLGHFASRLIDRPSRFAALRIVAGGRWKCSTRASIMCVFDNAINSRSPSLSNGRSVELFWP
jgi:hypothetical protein